MPHRDLYCRHPVYYTYDVDLWLDKLLIKFDEDHDCLDNIRLAEVGDVAQEAEYQESQEHGCCGSFDEIFFHEPTGRKFMLGFNFGH